MNSRQVVKRVFTIEFKVKDFIGINDDIDLFILGIANIRNKDGWTALIHASYHNHLEVVQTLIQAGASINIQENEGWTALMLASRYNRLEIVQALIKAGASINIQDNDGWTALMFASYQNHLEVVQALIQAGADVNIKNNDGKTALGLTTDIEIKDLLKQAGAK